MNDMLNSRRCRAMRAAFAAVLLWMPFVAYATTYTVTSTGDSASTTGTLRWAIGRVNANAATAPHTIAFAIGSGQQIITPASALPTITVPVTIDGTTQPGYAGRPLIGLYGASAGSTSHGLVLSGGQSTVRGLGIIAFSRSAIYLQTNGSNVVEACYLGTDGTGDYGNGWDGVSIVSGSNNRIGGTSTSQRNLISGNTEDGIYVEAGSTGNTIQGNYIGTNAAGTAAIANGMRGIVLNGDTNTVGGTATGAGNVISGNGGRGIVIAGSSNVFQGNIVGLDASGNAIVHNGSNGVSLEGGSGNVIGGSTAAARNVISGNNQSPDVADGIWITNSTGNVIRGNYIGTDATGTLARGNYNSGVAIWSSGNVVGGTSAGDGNLIAFNGSDGVIVAQNAINNQILGNSITSNGGLGIDFDDNGVTTNNGTKSNTITNRGMDYPVFTAATIAAGQLTVTGYVGSAAGQSTFASARVELFLSDGSVGSNGEGATYLGFLTSDSTGRIGGSIASGRLAAGDRITATATDSTGNTSEFGPNFAVTQGVSASGSGPLAEWRFEETSWSGATGEVKDSSGNGNDLTAYGTANTAVAAGAAASCRYGKFNGNSDRVGVYGDQRLAPSVALTAMAWIYVDMWPTDWMTVVSKDVTYEFHLQPSGEILWWWGGGVKQLETVGAGITAKRWVHIAITYVSGQQRIYIDGVQRAAGTQTGTLDVNGAPFLIGVDVATSATYDLMPERSFRGAIDNVRVYDRALSAAEVQGAMSATTPCSMNSVTGYVVTTANQGLYCLDHSVTVTPVDANGNAVSSYTGTMNLTTSTSRGTWLLQTGSGTLVDSIADDGAASYTFPGSQSSATFWLRYRTGGAVVNVDAAQSGSPTIRDSDTEGSITFSPSGFTVTSTPISAPVTSIPAFTGSVTAGTNQSVYLTAYGQTPADATCGVIAGYTGAKQLKFWLTRSDPATGTVSATVNASTIASAEASSAAQAVTFSSGQASVTFKYKDVGRISLSMKDDTTGNASLPTGIRGSTGSFVSKPSNFTVTNVKRTTDNVVNPGTTTASGTVFLAAGRPFTATVTAVDAEGSTTPNYGRETTAESVRFTTALVLPASGAAPAVTGSFGTFSSGSATGTAFAWNEVGTMRLVPRVSDGDYLAAGDVVGTASSPVGRFVPDRFEVAQSTPLFQTGCAAGSFTYVGQPFVYSVAPVITATAVALGGTATTNYTGSLFRLTNATIGVPVYAASGYVLDTSGLPASGADPTIVDVGSGVARLTYSAGTGLALARTTPVAPFSPAITLTEDVVDADGVRAASSVVFGASGGILFTLGATQRYGRVVVRGAAGSELLDLPVRTVVQYWLDAARGFTTATDDQCTAAPTITLRDWKRNLSTGETCVRDSGSPGTSGAGCPAAAAAARRYRASASAGDFNLVLAAPGAGNSGAVTVEAAPHAWLRYDWNVATPGLENPAALATFGVFQGSAQRVYEREVY